MLPGCLQRHSLFISHAFMMFLCVINFDILRNLKESLLITRMGAEIIPFIKLWVVTPSAFLFVFCYSFLANRLSRQHLFVFTIVPFLVWMPLFSLYLYPNLTELAPSSFCQTLYSYLPDSLILIGGLLEHWPLTLLFACAELWSTGVICTLLWSTVNDASTVESSSREYPLLTMAGNSASLLSGPMILLLVRHLAINDDDGWQISLVWLSVVFVVCGLMIIWLYYHSIKLAAPLSATASRGSHDNTATRLPLKDSFLYLVKCPYLRNIALIMLAYCIAINTAEVAWKSQVLRVYPTETEYSMLMGQLTFYSGLGCLLMAGLTAWLVRYSWRIAALGTPLLMAFTGIPFFLAVVLSNSNWLPEALSTPMLLAGISIGTLCNVASKSAKYTLFDATKEMAFVPLNNEQKLKGKASIELIVSRAGKSSSALVQQLLIVTLGSLTASMHWLASVFMIITIVWLLSVNALSKQYRRHGF
ncbi:NTP/NDP exchange transporter [Endozoicomonas euniceicola]|uniref:ADP,ATP carrier protein n=1 Tax=Endozoicomonas euniceicola TaxID=1234143 RepID=A0ABY6H1D8_9GAMM|nr:NTP/NDP exchange transporter [Endozoicomonas euniceicola]UYM18028.1 NTP/NDP exchange transporter [Endozoicomonas euniceicola]